ncbi:MAG: UDP-2,3-diacylglucosamine diphosphatase [Planctomycetes bacterium]|nr:UDP-2,3-diacylglucosamine diphosphatase [Planctomycetota bacterium]MCB9904116.1 UDP-2,3-diacylglucosamine diphosphatase [Planctomycetota bacterium]
MSRAPDPPRDLDAIALPAGSLAIADLHLDPASAEHSAAFVDFTRRVAGAPALLILGDFYDAWVGRAHAALPGAAATIQALSKLTASGTGVHVLHGNRDFLLDAHFERATGARIHPRGLLSRLPGGSACLWIHGDELCTLDHAYQRLRRVIRSGPVRGLSRTLPLGVGRGIARRLRSASVQAVAAKLPDEKSIQLDAARRWAREAAVPRLVCGHAHEYRRVELGDGAELIVLDAFGGPRDVLVVGAAGELEAHGSASWVTG